MTTAVPTGGGMLKPGQRLAQFEILEKLGEGGMGAVYLALDRKLERRVAIKLLPDTLLDDETRRARFEREARTAARISHPGVMGIFDLGEAPDEATGGTLRYIVMEYVEGEPLHAYLRSHSLDMAEGLRLAEKLAAGLAAAHKLGIVHRDIKPENVIVTADGDPKILDFGLAKPAEPVFRSEGPGRADATQELSGDLTQAGRIVGTVNYMSPEQAQGGAVDTRSDIFSFGVLLYRIATGEAPFAGPTQVSVLARIIEGRHESPRLRNAAVPPELERIIDKCLAKDPRDRYQDTRDLVVDLRVLRRQYESGVVDSGGAFTPGTGGPSGERTGTSISTGGAPAPSPVAGGAEAVAARRGRRVVPVIAGFAVLAVVVAVTWVALRGGGSSSTAGERRLAVLAFENRTGDQDLAWLETGLPEILVTDLARSEGIALLSREKVNDQLRRDGEAGIDEASASRVRGAATRLGATAILTGSVFRVGAGQIRIDARLEDARSGRILAAEKVQGTDAMALVDSLTARVAKALAPGAGAAPSGSVTEITTASSEAFKHYHIGSEKFLLGLQDEARAELGLAIEADTTFALAYMNMAISYMFEGRAQAGIEYLRRAQAHRDRLPAGERAILDIYSDLWIERQFADAFAKLETYVTSYPDDKRAATIYGALVLSFAADSTKAFAQFGAVLARDPGYPLALSQYAESLWGYREQARAIDLMQRFRRFHPESPTPYARLGYFYAQQGKLADALAIFEEFRRRFPADVQVNEDMSDVLVRARDFARARAVLDEMPRIRPDDPLTAITYERAAANLDLWAGKFESAVERHRRAVATARALGDSLQISVALSALSAVQDAMGRREESLETTREASSYLPGFNRLSYPIALAELHPERAAEARRLMAEVLEAFKQRTPRELWSIGDLLQEVLEGHADRDTTALLATMERIVALPANQGGRGNRRTYAELLARVGRHEEALPYLEEFISGAEESAGAWSYLSATYFAGRCLEGMGRPAEAKEKYAEVLRYWGHADVEVEPAREARSRLARLTS